MIVLWRIAYWHLGRCTNLIVKNPNLAIIPFPPTFQSRTHSPFAYRRRTSREKRFSRIQSFRQNGPSVRMTFQEVRFVISSHSVRYVALVGCVVAYCSCIESKEIIDESITCCYLRKWLLEWLLTAITSFPRPPSLSVFVYSLSPIKVDESDDSIFYDSPRLVYHIDDAAVSALTKVSCCCCCCC